MHCVWLERQEAGGGAGADASILTDRTAERLRLIADQVGMGEVSFKFGTAIPSGDLRLMPNLWCVVLVRMDFRPLDWRALVPRLTLAVWDRLRGLRLGSGLCWSYVGMVSGWGRGD